MQKIILIIDGKKAVDANVRSDIKIIESIFSTKKKTEPDIWDQMDGVEFHWISKEKIEIRVNTKELKLFGQPLSVIIPTAIPMPAKVDHPKYYIFCWKDEPKKGKRTEMYRYSIRPVNDPENAVEYGCFLTRSGRNKKINHVIGLNYENTFKVMRDKDPRAFLKELKATKKKVVKKKKPGKKANKRK